MSKKITPLKALDDLVDYLELEHYTLSEDEGVVERKQIIETALKRLEKYEKNEDFSKDAINYAFLSEKDKIKKLKALDIIKENLNIDEILLAVKGVASAKDYDLVKEVLL